MPSKSEKRPCCNNALVVVPLRHVVCLVLALSAVAVAFVSGPSLYGGMALSVFRFQDLLFITKAWNNGNRDPE